MADYIYLLTTRLTAAQQRALATVRDIARAQNYTVFLVGGAVRDLTSGISVRDLDVVVQGNALKLKKELEKAGGQYLGESDIFQSLYFHFPGGVRIEIGTALSVTYPKPGKPVAKPATILDDLHRRDFTANAMAISLNEGSYGLLMDPLNGMADIENRELRLVSNYGFIEDPSRMIRAIRFEARLGWQMEERTRQRYENGKQEDYIAALNPAQRAYETEEILREEDPLRILRKLEAEGWTKFLNPLLSVSKVNENELNRLRDTVGQLNGMGIFPDTSAANFAVMTAKLQPKDIAALKKSFARPGFSSQIDALEADAKALATQFTAKENAAPSAAWKLLGSAVPESVLWLAHSSRSAPVQAKFKAFFNDWPSARQKIPYTLMQEMRITPDLPGYDELVDKIFFAIMDGLLDTPEAARAFLEPYSPPAPPPPVNLRRRAAKREAKPSRARAKKAAVETEEETIDLAAEGIIAELADAGEAPTEEEEALVPAPKAKPAKAPAKVKESKPAGVAPKAPKAPAKVASKAAPAKSAAKTVAPKKPAAKPSKKTVPASKAPAKKAPARKSVAKPAAKKAVKVPAKAAKTAKPAPKKAAVKKPAPKPAAKKVPAKLIKKPAAKAAPKKPAPKPAKKAPAKKGRR